MAVEFRRNRGAMRDILRSDPVGDMVERIAEQAAGRARGLAPVESGNYRDSLEVRRVMHGDRVVAQVWATVEYAREVEARTGTLARSL